VAISPVIETKPDSLKVRQLEHLDPHMVARLTDYGSESLGSAAPGEWLLPVIARWGLLYVAEEEGEIIGSAQLFCGAEASEVYMDGFFIRPGYRGRGYGRSLLAVVADRLRARGYCRLVLTLDPRNQAAASLYQGAGFREIAKLDDFYGYGRDRWLMSLELGCGGR
jgi:ribosomal protein S18 acetylase RimI-like enzyme